VAEEVTLSCMVQAKKPLIATPNNSMQPTTLRAAAGAERNTTGLRTALWRCGSGVELPLLAELRHSTAAYTLQPATDFQETHQLKNPYPHLRQRRL